LLLRQLKSDFDETCYDWCEGKWLQNDRADL